ncbi:trypsin-like cysteine/serine peptidase domain-containing protein [Hyaloraphidium curvatum]|nr:trypsin-like cysteine/serine peptidase domain-containing protein [Hyaloraphidium curvatum]
MPPPQLVAAPTPPNTQVARGGDADEEALGRAKRRRAENGEPPGAKRPRDDEPPPDEIDAEGEMEMDYSDGASEEGAGGARRPSLSGAVQPIPVPETQPQWLETLERCVRSIVAIRFSQVAAFDTDQAGNSEASGFVVDAERGIILTNRHVVCAGPFVGEAVFHDHEETDVWPIYRDPVHDFGFLRFDPSKIRYLPLASIPLRPDLARVGLDIRVVGNDAGEKLSILAGSISRLDRNAPDYGEGTYCDFNTFYLQAAASTSGGSSGSPVIDINGNAVGLQAGGATRAATDYFFPLDRVKRALEIVQNGGHVTRGTIQAQWYHRPFDEIRRLGLRPETESKVRSLFPTEIGMLVAETVLPGGPASAFLEEGDVLVSVNGQVCTKFVPLEEMLDTNVGGNLKFVIERGGEEMEFDIAVQDLHSITPNRFVEVGGAKLNDLSYQLARQYCVPVSGVYVAEAAGMFRLEGADSGWIITSVDVHPTPNLDAFVDAISKIPDRERVPITYYSIADVHTQSVAIASMERHWSRFKMWTRVDDVNMGYWTCKDLGEPLPPRELAPVTAHFAELDESLGKAKDLIRSLVKVSYYMPCRMDGFPKSRKTGAGLIVDAEKGLVVVGRNIVPFDMGDVSLTFADSIIIPGKVVFLHPTHNFAFVSYDPKLIGETPVTSAVFSKAPLGQGHHVTLVAFNHNHRPICVETVVTDVSAVTIPQSATPRFRAVNFDAITLDTPLAQQCSSGVLADKDGLVQGIWISFLGERSSSGHDNEYHLGVHVDRIAEVVELLKKGRTPVLRGLTIEVMPVPIAQARHMGLTEEWVAKVEAANPSRRQVFLVRRVETGTKTAEVLKELDLILSIEGKTITRVTELDVGAGWKEEVEMVIIRKKEVLTLTVPTTELDGEGTKKCVSWAGVLLQEPHKAVLQQSKHLPSRVYISGRSKGSPGYMYGFIPTQWILAVNGKRTSTLEEFLEAVKGVKDNSYVRVKTMSFDQVPCMLSVKINRHYWPTVHMVKDASSPNGWQMIDVEEDKS